MTIMGMKKDPNEKKKGLQRTMFKTTGKPLKRTALKRRGKGTGKKRKVKTPLQKMHDKCWEMAKKCIKLRDHGQCQHCFKPAMGSNGHTSHVYPKSTHGALKYILINLKLLCYHCHMNWWHKNPIEAADWFTENWPERRAKLEVMKRLKSYRVDILQEILEELQTEYERLKGITDEY